MTLRMKKTQIDIYGNENCHLCEIAKETLKKFQVHYNFQINQIDITKDEKIYEKYKNEIPVVFINGKEYFKYKVEEERLIKLLNTKL